MAYTNFKPQIWAADIIKEREDVIVAAKICNRDYEGTVKEFGDKVKINGVARPAIVDYSDETGLGDFQKLKDQSTMLEITQSKAFHFYVGDIDKRQAKGDMVSEEKKEAAAGLAEAMDSFIYSEILKTKGATKSAVESLSTANILSTIASGLSDLWKAGVPRNEVVYLECSPEAVAKLMLAKLIVDTDNTKTLVNGSIGKLRTLNVSVEMSNNIPSYNTSGEYMIMRTKKAVTLAEQITEVKVYEPQNYFGEAIKGLQVYGAKVIRPKEVRIIPITAFATETTI